TSTSQSDDDKRRFAINSSSLFSFEKPTNTAPMINNTAIRVGVIFACTKVKYLGSLKNSLSTIAKTFVFIDSASSKPLIGKKIPRIAEGIKRNQPSILYLLGNNSLLFIVLFLFVNANVNNILQKDKYFLHFVKNTCYSNNYEMLFIAVFPSLSGSADGEGGSSDFSSEETDEATLFQSFQHLFRQFGSHQFVGLPNIMFPLFFIEAVCILYIYPLMSRHIRCGDNARACREFFKFLISNFKGGFKGRRKTCYAEHFSANAKTQVIAQFNIFSSMR